MFTNNSFREVKHRILKQLELNEHIPLNDMEGQMASSELSSIIEYANEIQKMLKPETQMEAWVQSKITKAKDYLDSVADYLKHSDGVLEDYNSPKLRRLDKDGDKRISTHDFKHLRRKKKK